MAADDRFFGRFKILNRIGQGGMGSLYRAHDPMLDREVAIKVLRDGFDNDELRERFAREAQSAARLRHPNIVTIFDVGEQDGKPFIAMEYIQGVTLGDIVRNAAATPIGRKLELMEDIASALGFAHKRGIVHRDIKPANLMVDTEGTLKVLDFGIARITESGLTQSGMMMGTLNYMSPEQLGGGVVDQRSDIFAVGAVYYELLSGKQAFPGGIDTGVLNRILNGATDDLAQLCPTLDRSVIDIVKQCIQPNPKQRYQDLSATKRDIQNARRRLDSSDDSGTTVSDIETAAVPTPLPVRGTPVRSAVGRTDLERRRREQVEKYLRQAEQHLASQAYEEAMEAADQALLLEPENPSGLELHERARVLIDAQRGEELLRDADDQLARGATSAAEQLLNRALQIAPAIAGADALRQRITAARRERERLERLRAALDRAANAIDRGDFEGARQAAHEALEIAPDSSEGQRLASVAENAIAADEVRRRVRGAIESAQTLFKAARYDDALAVLDTFSPADDSIARARADIAKQVDTIRKAQEQQARAEAERRRKETQEAERIAAERKREALERERAAAQRELPRPQVVFEPAPAPTPSPQVPPVSVPTPSTPLPKWALPAAAAVVLLIVLAVVIPKIIDNTTTTTSVEPTTTVAPTSITTTSQITSAPTTTPTTATSVPTTTSVAPTSVTSSVVNPRLVTLRATGREQLTRGNLPAALAAVAEGLRIDGNDAEVRRILVEIRTMARRNALAAQSRVGPAQRSSGTYLAAQKAFDDADAYTQRNRDEDAARFFLNAASQFSRAASEVVSSSSIAPTTTTTSRGQISIVPTTTSAPPTSVTTSVAPPPTTSSVPPPTTTSQQRDPRADAIAGINAALDACEAAWVAMNASRLALCGPTLATSARDRMRNNQLQSQRLRIGSRNLAELTQDSATVSVVLTFVDVFRRDGQERTTTSPGAITLLRQGQAWVVGDFQRGR